MNILGIESSCDETSTAIVRVTGKTKKVLSQLVSSQVKIHAKYGGVVPEVAARLHMEKMLPLIDLSLSEAKIGLKDLDAIAVCSGPGLVSALQVGVETAKTLAQALKIKLIKVNHLEGHLLAAEIGAEAIKFPALGLIVSGGHTQLVLAKNYGQYKIIGETRDDAAGEAFDKAAKILDLGYPGGPAIAKAADAGHRLEPIFKLPRPMIASRDFDMSFSGLKTALLYSWQKVVQLKQDLSTEKLTNAKLAAAREFQDAVTDVLVAKTLAAAAKYQVKTLIIGGGVSANRVLREKMAAAVAQSLLAVRLIIPELKLTGDNAAMIAWAGAYRALEKKFVNPFDLKSDPNWLLSQK